MPIPVDSCTTFVVITTPTTTVTVTGGSGPITYSWAWYSGSTGVTATNPTSATTAFKATVNASNPRVAIMRCTVTRGAATTFVDVQASLIYSVEAPP
jgi:hypothetical protein